MAITRGPSIVRDGLVLCLDAKDPNSYSGSGSTWSDVSSNGNNGTITSPGPTYSSSGYFDFDGSTGRSINIANDSSLNPSYVTLSCWVKFDSVAVNRQLIAKRASASAGAYWLYVSASNQFMFDTYENSTQNRLSTTYSFSTGVWYNIVGTFSPGSKIQYVNASSVNSTTNTASLLTGYTTDIKLGLDTSANQYPLDGQMANVMIYNRGLSAAEVLQNYNAQKSRFQ